jgi:hypothetical protein
MYDKAFTLDDIRALNPCEDPTEYEGVTEEWAGTAQDILSAEQVKPDDRLWVVLQLSIPHRIKLEFAWGAATQVRHLMLDERSTHTLDVLRAYLDGSATVGELKQARSTAAEASQAAARAAVDAERALQKAPVDAVALAFQKAAALAARAVVDAVWAAEDAAWAAVDAAREAAWAMSWAATPAAEDVTQGALAAGAVASLEDMRRPQILHLLTLLNTYTAPSKSGTVAIED